MFHTPGCPDACLPLFFSLSVVQEVPPPAWLFSPSLSVSVSRPAAVVSLSPRPTLPAVGPKVRGQHSKAKLKGFNQSLSFLKTNCLITLNPISSFPCVWVGMTGIWQKGATFQQKLSVTNWDPNWARYWDIMWDYVYWPTSRTSFSACVSLSSCCCCRLFIISVQSASLCSRSDIWHNTNHLDHLVTWRVG